MAFAKSILGITLTVSIAILLLIGGAAAYSHSQQPQDLWLYIYIATSLFVILLGFCRLKLGLNLSLGKKKKKYQEFSLLGISIALLGIFFFMNNYSGFGWIGVLLGALTVYVAENRTWEYFTEIRESDHSIYKKRLYIGLGTWGGMALLFLISSFFAEGVIEVKSFEELTFAVVNGVVSTYLVSSFVVGWIVMRDNVFRGGEYLKDSPEHKAHMEELRRKSGWGTKIGIPTYDGGNSIFRAVYYAGSAISALILGTILIPFYAYVVITKKVTVNDCASESNE